MKRILLAAVLIAVVLTAGCAQSVIDDVVVSNVEHESYRPEGYVLTGDLGEDGFAWDGVVISCDVTNKSNKTLKVAVIVNSYVGKDKKYNRYDESNIVSIDPDETKRLECDFNYEDQDVIAAWSHDISDVVAK